MSDYDIPPGDSEVCLILRAADDEIVENSELFSVTVETTNQNDVANGTALILISDNDGMN